MKLLFENWRKYLNEIIINHDGKYQLYATKPSLQVLLNTIKDYKAKGYDDKAVKDIVDQHVLRHDFRKYTHLGGGYKFTVEEYNKLVDTFLKKPDKDVKEMVDLFISGELDNPNYRTSQESEDSSQEADAELENFLKPRRVTAKALRKFPLLQSVEDNMELFSRYKTYSDAMKEELNELGFDIAGRGASRNAFGFNDSDKYILKVANTAPPDAEGSRSEMNLRDVRIGTNPKYKEFAPQVYAYDPEGRWFVVERTLPFKRPYATFKKTFPELNKLIKVVKNKEVRETFRELPIWSFANMLKVATDDASYSGFAERYFDAYKKLHKIAYKKDPTYKNFFDMSNLHSIDLEDLFTKTDNWKNIGIGAGDGKLKITDPSTQR
jgi:hypothetical protein